MKNVNPNVNFILNCDSYKIQHRKMLKKHVDGYYSTIVPRKSSPHSNHVVVAGLQYTINTYINIQITKEDVDEAEIEIREQGSRFDRTIWDKIVNEFGGKVPVKISAIKEGTVVPVQSVVCVVEAKDEFAFLASYIETCIQRGVWYSSTVASECRAMKKILADVMQRHAGHKNVDYHFHNFGDRSATCFEHAYVAGMAHAIMFNGSDSLTSNRYIKAHYNTTKAYLSSVDATEHSVMCSNSDAEHRNDYGAAVMAVDHWEEQVTMWEEDGLGVPVTSCVIDTYNDYRFVRDFIGTKLKDRIVEIGKRGGRFVLRPDSRIPKEICIDVIEILMEKFGYTINEHGYKVLPPYIGVIQGDGVNFDSIHEILDILDEKKLSLENIVFGCGTKLVNPERGRDLYSWSMKGTAQHVEDEREWQDLFKDPAGEPGKRSHKGRVVTWKCKVSGKIFVDRDDLDKINHFIENLLVPMYDCGKIMNFSTFDEVRERANAGI
ncbi:putative nicotinate phosphoribosyltransferase [Klebsiella phage K64-1]|uniref:Nicotinamide phosphoribosyltransferase n=1 Tax=Klebsiella phage K64-1 TaxID=1439894 RepID=A0A0A8J8S4_BPK64|nr:nicotinamide phosphoribosyl transferase [Klebsiella phage K64-1]BAQ02831.1 putative nicotinate phosphoribosyltransferase [Klebsiella phage K64-1]